MRVEKVETQPTPPWLQPPKTYKPKGKFAEKTALAKAAATAVARPPPTSRPTAATTQKVTVSSTTPLGDSKSNMEKAMEVITRSGSSLNRLTESTEDSSIPRSESALEQLARTASAAKFVEDIVNGEEDTEVPNKKLSKSSIQGSFEALMSMDIHSVENLVELAATSNSSAILSELNKTYSDAGKGTSSNNLSNRMESFIKSLSTANLLKSGLDSQQAIGSLLGSTSSFFDGDKISGRNESSTGFSQLRAADGLANGPHDSVGDFLSLVASGDIPHQDPNLLQVPLQKVMQQAGISKLGSKRKLSQQQLSALASHLAGSINNLSEAAAATGATQSKKKKQRKRK